jgi:RND family efflux transporter MFP subunit
LTFISHWVAIFQSNRKNFMDEETRKTALRAVFSFLAVLLLVGLSLGIAIVLVVNRRLAAEVEAERPLPTVELLSVKMQDHPVVIETQGVVESRRETSLAAELTGRVVEISPNLKRGAVVAEGERLVQIDPADYRSALARAEAALAEARLVLAQEEARSDQARMDWQKLGRGAGSPLVLREPQREAAQATVASAQAEVERARRDVERTEIRAPFAASVRDAAVEVGAVVNPGQKIATLFSASDLEVRLALPLEDFGFLQRAPDGTAKGRTTLRGTIGGELYEWPAEPVRLDQEIDRRTLSGHLIVRVIPQPGSAFSLPPVGLFVQAKLEGSTLAHVAEVPRRALLEGSRALVLDADARIQFRDVDVIRTTRDTAVVRSGLTDGERLVLTRLSAPVNGMQVRPESAPASTSKESR